MKPEPSFPQRNIPMRTEGAIRGLVVLAKDWTTQSDRVELNSLEHHLFTSSINTAQKSRLCSAQLTQSRGITRWKCTVLSLRLHDFALGSRRNNEGSSTSNVIEAPLTFVGDGRAIFTLHLSRLGVGVHDSAEDLTPTVIPVFQLSVSAYQEIEMQAWSTYHFPVVCMVLRSR